MFIKTCWFQPCLSNCIDSNLWFLPKIFSLVIQTSSNNILFDAKYSADAQSTLHIEKKKKKAGIQRCHWWIRPWMRDHDVQTSSRETPSTNKIRYSHFIKGRGCFSMVTLHSMPFTINSPKCNEVRTLWKAILQRWLCISSEDLEPASRWAIIKCCITNFQVKESVQKCEGSYK